MHLKFSKSLLNIGFYNHYGSVQLKYLSNRAIHDKSNLKKDLNLAVKIEIILFFLKFLTILTLILTIKLQTL